MTPLRDVDDSATGTVIVMRDLSEQKFTASLLGQMEEQRRRSQKLEAASLLAGGIAHHFNNLLSVILGQTLLLLNNAELDENTRESLTQTKLAAERASELTSQLLTISGRQVRTTHTLNLNELLTDMEDEISSELGKHIALSTCQRPDLWKVKADSGQVKQVIQNLVQNAKHAMSEGGSLSIETANIQLQERTEPEYYELDSGPYVMLTVSDTGCGMSPEVRSHAFEPFFTTQEVGNGNGLGLPMVYGIVKQYGGDIAVESRPGLGSTFRICLPATEDEIPDADLGSNAPHAALAGDETVLVVEDEDMVRSLICQVLRTQGYGILESTNPEEAIKVCQAYEGRIDLLITDIVMPGMDGGRLAERITEIIPGVKVLFLSGYPDYVALREDVLNPQSNFVQKPFTFDILIQRVREALGREK